MSEKLNVIAALRKAVEALKELSEKDFVTAERKAFALRAFHEANQKEFFDPNFGDYFAWTDDEEFGGSDIDSACDMIEMEPYNLVQLTRVVRLPDVFVICVPDGDSIKYEVYDTEDEADAAATAAEEAAGAAE